MTAPSWINPAQVTQSASLQSNQVLKITIPAALRLTSGGLEKKAIRIEADADITLFGMNKATGQCGGFLVIPIDALGFEYFVKGYQATNPSGNIFIY